jgi:alkyl sulfatase BDS1-like metallo-beta-lactamase superfamily hydrolase
LSGATVVESCFADHCQGEPDAVGLYDMADRRDFADTERGFIAPWPDKVVSSVDGHVIFDAAWFDFLADEDAAVPDTVNPSLWRQGQLIRRGGLFKVTEGVYQARNSDIANLTIVEGETGLVIVDCMSGVESAAQGLAMFREHVSGKAGARRDLHPHAHRPLRRGEGRGRPGECGVGQGADHCAGHHRVVRQVCDR